MENGNSIVVKQKPKVTIERPKDPFEIMEGLDDELILAEIEGRVVETWVYHFPGENGQEQWGLSKVGVDAACAELSKRGEVIRELELHFEKDPVDPEYIVFISRAGRYAVAADGKEILLDTAFGTKRQWIKTKLRDGTVTFNKFYFEHGSMKALRNARSRLIDEEIKTKIIAFAKEKNKTKNVIVKEKGKYYTKSSKDVGSKYSTKAHQVNSAGVLDIKRIWGLVKEIGIDSERLHKGLGKVYGKKSLNDLTKEEASDLIRRLEKQSATGIAEEASQNIQ